MRGWPAYLQFSLTSSGEADIHVLGVKGRACWLQASTNLANWLPVATNQFGPYGTTLFHTTGSNPRTFYRVALP